MKKEGDRLCRIEICGGGFCKRPRPTSDCCDDDGDVEKEQKLY
jgi:hypothetical protein